MILRVRPLVGDEKIIEIEPTDQIGTVKEKLQEAEGTSVDQQRLIYQGKFLKNEKTVENSLYQNWLYQRYQNLAMPDELKSFLETLRMKFRIALITNGTSACQWEKIEKLHLKDCFDLILVSGDLSYEKPDKHIFFQACELLNVSPKNCLMVGDKLETDIQGGFEAGLAATVWISRNTRYYLTKTDPKPDYILSDIMELKYLIANILDMENMRVAAKKLQDCSLYCDEDSACAGSSFSDHHKRMFANVFNLDEDSNSNASDGS